MMCSCPKCQAQIDLDITHIPEYGTFTPCPECKGRFWVSRESYARMALKKDGAIYCDKCSRLLDQSIVCSGCGVMYPDYYLVQASKPPRRQVEKADLFSVSFSLKPAKQTYTYSYAAPKRSVSGTKALLGRMLFASTIIILIAMGIGYFYYIKKTEDLFAANYMRTLYVLKSGTELSLNTCAQVSTEWREKSGAGKNYVPRAGTEVETRLSGVKEQTERFMKRLDKPPKKFVDSREKLATLYRVYIKAHSLAVEPSGSLASYVDQVAKSTNEFNQAKQDIKNGLPAELTKEFEIAKLKYKGLRDI